MPDDREPAPRLSDDAIASYRDLLARPDFLRDHPDQHAMIAASVHAALAETGQSLAPPSDGRSPAQALIDRQFGVTFADGKVALPSELAAIVERDVEGAEPDCAEVKGQVEGAGIDYLAALRDAGYALERTGLSVKPTSLSAHSLAQLAIWGQHLRAHAKSRP